jgi:uncharacterized membrane protein YvlD (DUF360 family)
VRLLVAWLLSAAALLVAAWIVPGASTTNFGGALVAALVIAVLNAVLPPLVAALRLPLMLLTGFLLILVVDALMLLAADSITNGDLTVDSFWSALGVALVAAAVGVILDAVAGSNDDDTYTFRVTQRIARRGEKPVSTDAPGIVFLEIDGLALPVLQRAMRDGSTPNMARWLSDGSHALAEWETDLSSQTGASQAGILLGSNEDIPAFRWVEKETGKLMTCSAPPDCAEIERRHSSGRGLLSDGGASRGNLLSGEADHMILTVSRIDAEKHANPGYRAFLANGFNVMRALVLFGWEVVLEWTAASRAKRRDVRPRGNRGGKYPFLRAALCVVVRDVIVYGVLTDMMEGRPAVYATFSSYDEVAHHSGLERADTLEALRKLDQQFGRIERARRYAPRPYELVVLSDHGQTQGATFKQRNGYGLDELVERSLEHGGVTEIAGGDEQSSMVGHAIGEATGQKPKKPAKNDVSDRDVIVLGSGNLGLVYLMDERRRLTLEELNDRHPRLLPALGSRRGGSALPRLWARRRNGSVGTVFAECSSTFAAHRRLRACRRHHGRELLRPIARRGLRIRGADLLPRRTRRSPDSSVSSLPRIAPVRRRADCRRCGGQPSAQRLASPTEWRDSGQRRDAVAVGPDGTTSAGRSLSAPRQEDGDVLSAQQLGSRARPGRDHLRSDGPRPRSRPLRSSSSGTSPRASWSSTECATRPRRAGPRVRPRPRRRTL